MNRLFFNRFSLMLADYYPLVMHIFYQRLLILAWMFTSMSLATVSAQESIARQWNELILQAIREDIARPPVQARNLMHTSLAMYDAWAAYDTVAQTCFLGKSWGTYSCPFVGVPKPTNVDSARHVAISYAVYRVVLGRFRYSPNTGTTNLRFTNFMRTMGYDPNYNDVDYTNGSPASLGNYIGNQIIRMGLADYAQENFIYFNLNYTPVNLPLDLALVGNPNMVDPNRWQPLSISGATDKHGNPIPSIQRFQSPEWGDVVPFAMTNADKTTFSRNGKDYLVYHDPGAPPQLDTSQVGGMSEEWKWNHELVAIWSSHLDPTDGVLWDISPASIGNVQALPQGVAALRDFYDLNNGGDTGNGHAVNPHTGQPYQPQIVPRGDYTRVLVQFWADGPNSETPPGHWYSILNYVSDQPELVKKFNGKGELLSDLEWDIKAYFTLGGAVHDAAISAWGIKGWYDGSRPISAIRYMAGKGQSSNPALPRYHPGGVTLVPGFIEMVLPGDTLAGPNNEHLNKIKLMAWKGHSGLTTPASNFAGKGWILAENWMPYLRKTIVTPPFGGYISGHSTYSRASAVALTKITGDAFFPGGMGEFHIGANSGFLGFETGPSVDITLQWATYTDASDQTSLSRIWGGIHPPFDDIPGRIIGAQCGEAAFQRARSLFYRDADADGY